MADYQHHELKSDEPCEAAPAPVKIEEIDQPVEATDRGLFDFFGKKKDENRCEEDAIASEFDDKVQVCDENKEEPKFEFYEEKKEEPKFEFYEEKKEEPKFEVCQEKKEEPKGEEKKHESLLEKLHGSNSSSSSSSEEDEEVEEGGEKKKKKKGLKEKIKEKITGDKKEEAAEETSHVPFEKCDEIPTTEPEEKKGFLDKIKEKLPGGKKTEEVSAAPPPLKEEVVECAIAPEAEGKEKKGFLDKIKEKLPGYHPKGEEVKEKGKGAEACH